MAECERELTLEDFKGQNCAFVTEWLQQKGLQKLCAVFEGDEMNISEDQKRWLVIGIAFNKLVPQIRPFVEQSLQAEYQRLRTSHNIDVQTPPGPILKNHPKHLKYENINNNINNKHPSGKYDFSKFDYKVTSHVDFAKLYVQPFMAKFSAFDGKCDGSAVLLLLGEVPAFGAAIQSKAKVVKDHVRNEWAHCNFTDWDAVKFQSCFQEMQQLVQSISLPAADETKLLSELKDWETKGTTFCGNSPVDPSLLNLVQNEVSQLSLNLDDFVCQYKEQKDLLESQFLEVKQSLDQLLELPQKFEQMEHEVQTLKRQMADLSCSSVEGRESAKLPTFFGALDRNEYFTGRKKELENLEKAFGDSNTERDVRGAAGSKGNVHGICGLGGCGKSSLAFEYAWRNLERYPGGVFVVNGESDDLMRASLQRIHGAFVPNTQTNQHGEAKQFDQLLTETLSWLGNLKDKWLLLVDNMDQQELSSCARTVFFGQWKSKAPVDILVTSRRSSQALCDDLDIPSQNCFELDPFSVDESVEFLKKRTGKPSSFQNQDQAGKQLAQELGGLPLALEQAAAYIKALKCSFQLYLQQYHSQKSSLLNTKSAKPRSEVYNEARLAVQTTWLLNFSYVENGGKDQGLGRAAAFFMKIAAYLSPDEIPIEILNIGAPEVEHEDLKRRLEMDLGTDQIVELLVRFSLFKQKSDDTLSIHRLVQEILRERCESEGETDKVSSSAIRMMHQAFLNCVGGTDYLSEVEKRLAPVRRDEISFKETFVKASSTIIGVTFECRRWKTLSVNAFHLSCNLLNNSTLKPNLFREESARLFCEAALHCYSLGMESRGYNLQQYVFEILCAMKEPIQFYKDDDLMKVTRILEPFADSGLISSKLAEPVVVRENVSDGTCVPVDTNETDRLLEAIKVIEPKAREAFTRGDFRKSADMYSDIVKISNFDAGRSETWIKQSHLVPLGDILCRRGIAHLRMGNIETAVDDFNASTSADIHHYRGYYWKAYALCKLVQSGSTEFTSRAQAAAAVLHFKFADSKPDDIQKLQKTFPGLLDRIEYKFVSQVSDFKELERLSEVRNDLSNCSLTIILGEGSYDLEKLILFGGRYYFVCPPGSSASLNCINGLYLSQGSFLFENIQFSNSALQLTETPPAMTLEKDVEEIFTAENLDTVTLRRTDRAETEAAGGTEREMSALIEANDVHSLVIDHCHIDGSSCSGIRITFTKSSHEQKFLSVRSSSITCCQGAGLAILGDANIDIYGDILCSNRYGIIINSTSRFHVKNNRIFGNFLSGVVAIHASEGRLLGNALTLNGRHGILFSDSNAIMENNLICANFGWGIVCSIKSSLHCEQNMLQNNLCGGLRIIFNGKGKVSVQKCEFRNNFGPAVLPTAANELCRAELEWNRLFASSRHPRRIIPLYLWYFLESAMPSSESIGEFTSPVLLDNTPVSDVSDMSFHIESHFCCTCFQDLQLDSDMIECPSCHVARYCNQQCSDAAKAVHYPVCKSILEANKECVDYEVWPLTNPPLPVQEDQRHKTGISMCVIASVTCTSPPPTVKSEFKSTTFNRYACLLTCPQRNLSTVVKSPVIHHFILIHGSHLPDRMMDIKAACILANFDSKSKIITVYKHRIFPLERIPDALNWVEETLHVFEQRVCGGEAQSNDTVRPKKRTSRKREQRFR